MQRNSMDESITSSLDVDPLDWHFCGLGVLLAGSIGVVPDIRLTGNGVAAVPFAGWRHASCNAGHALSTVTPHEIRLLWWKHPECMLMHSAVGKYHEDVSGSVSDVDVSGNANADLSANANLGVSESGNANADLSVNANQCVSEYAVVVEAFAPAEDVFCANVSAPFSSSKPHDTTANDNPQQ